jgi:predicted RNA methylase
MSPRAGQALLVSDEPHRDPEPSCCFDDWVPAWEHKSKRRATVAGVTAPLLEALVEAGLEGRTVLDVGCGIGDLSMAAIGRGAERATGIELSPKAIEVGTAIALERGLQDRMTFRPGDGSKVDLPQADVVVLNRVFCCYPDIESLVAHSLAAAGSVYAFTTPPSSGLASAFVRVFGWFSNVWYRLRERKFHGFRVFVHDIEQIDERVRAAGFRPIRRERQRFVWHLAVYAR